MAQEFINKRIRSRKKLVVQLLLTLAAVVAFLFIKYIAAPADYQSGQKHSRFWISYNAFVIISVMAALILVPMMFYTRLVLRLYVNSEENLLEIEYIDRFSINPRRVAVKLSQTQIETETREYKNRAGHCETYYSLHLHHGDFKTLTISALDFDNMPELIQLFDGLRIDTARKLRQRRLLKRKR